MRCVPALARGMVKNMQRFFNTAGPLKAAKHYVLDPLSRWDLPEVLSLIDQEKYFVVHAPRQTGKTTCLRALADYLNQQGEHTCLYISVERARTAGADIDRGLQAIMVELARRAEAALGDTWVRDNWPTIFDNEFAEGVLMGTLQKWCRHSSKPIVLLIDEIDSLADITLLSVLQQLRNGYCDRIDTPFPQTVVLCGMRDIRDYDMQLDKSKSSGPGPSPFNIKSDSLRLGDFSLDDIATLYAQHTQQTGQQFADGVYKQVFALTQGQPWLVNALAYDACFRDKAGRDRSKTITLQDIELSKERMIQRRETHLDQLMAKLQQERVHRVIGSIVSSQDLAMRWQDVEYCIDLGLVCRRKDGAAIIANPIYREIIPRFLMDDWQQRLANKTPSLGNPGQPLDMHELLSAFQRFFREHSESWFDQFQYKEAG
ncbi:MAG: AAA-like domain-containing protein, partial [Myxococcota bacterium]